MGIENEWVKKKFVVKGYTIFMEFTKAVDSFED
jgi:hypothetical protein